MKRTVELSIAILTCLTLTGTAEAQSRKKPAAARTAASKPAASPTLACGDWLGFQVRLDRQGFSPGQIDGKAGVNVKHALAAMQAAHKLPSTGTPSCATWKALDGGGSEPTITTYTVTDADVKGPFEKIPRTLKEQASLATLGYQSPLERLSERFHSSPALLQQLNRGVPIAAGREIRVPDVKPFDVDAKRSIDPEAGDITIQVSKAESALRATRADGTVVFYAPVTTGSQHDPLPLGDWKVLGVDSHPVFHYNPDLFWDAKATDSKATIKAGPNNPVGVVWVALNLEHYGLHGTPEPGNIGHTESHGCVRLTNWDAARVAALVKPGTPVIFK
jgi:lipoprotein-anchoring transpeptidase ErfK/SrfK